MGKNLGDSDETEIRKFVACKVQACRIVIDRKTGESRGIAFVDFPTTQEVDKAMKMNGKEIKPGWAVDMHFEAPKARPRPAGCLTVGVKKLPPQVTEKQIRRLFQDLPSISEVRIILNRGRECNGMAFVEFTEGTDVEAAVKRSGMSVGGQTVFVYYETKPKKERTKDGSCKSVVAVEISNQLVSTEPLVQAETTASDKSSPKRKQESAASTGGDNPVCDVERKAKKAKKDKVAKVKEITIHTTKDNEEAQMEQAVEAEIDDIFDAP